MENEFEILASCFENFMNAVTVVELTKITESAKTERLIESELAETERVRIREQASILHHKLDLDHEKFLVALKNEEVEKNRMLNILEKIILKSSELSEREMTFCMELLKTINKPGTSLEKIIEYKKIQKNILSLPYNE